MLKHLFITLLILLAGLTPLMAQDDWQSLYETWLEEADEEMSTTQQELLYDELSQLHDHPLDINTATNEELGRLPFLTPIHIEAIQRYIAKNGALLSMGELMLIDSLDYQTRNLLRHFVQAHLLLKKTENTNASPGKICCNTDTTKPSPA